MNIKLPHGTYAKLCQKHGVSNRTVRRIWDKRKEEDNQELIVQVLRSKKRHTGRPRIDAHALRTKLKMTPLRMRRTFRNATSTTNCSSATIWRALPRGDIRRESNSLKPILTDAHKTKRLNWCLKFVDERTMLFHDMYDYVHLDQKWFFLTKDKVQHLLAN